MFTSSRKADAADAKLEVASLIDKAEERLNEMKSRLSKIAEAGEDAWEDIAKGADNAWDDITGSIQSAWNRLRS